MTTNTTQVTVAVETTYTLPATPISYSSLTLLSGVPHKDQIVVLRKDIEDLLIAGGPITSARELRDLMLVEPSLFTFNEQTRQITAALNIQNYLFEFDDGSSVAKPAWSSGENLIITRKNIISEPFVTWVTGSRITADQLNLNTNQLIGLIQELYHSISNCINRMDFDAVVNPMNKGLNMNGFVISGLPTPVGSSDPATKEYVDSLLQTLLTDKLGQPNGIATLDATGKLTVTQSPAPLGTLPGSFFSSPASPTRGTGGNGLFKWGSLWYNTSNGRLYVYTPDNRYVGLDETHNGEIGYWVDVASPAV